MTQDIDIGIQKLSVKFSICEIIKKKNPFVNSLSFLNT